MSKIVKYYDDEWHELELSEDWTWRVCFTPQTSGEKIIGNLSILKKQEGFSDMIEIKNSKNPDLPEYLPKIAREKIETELFGVR